MGERIIAQPARARSVAHAPFSAALAAWFRGESVRCVALCDALPPSEQVTLLRSRALLRLVRPGDAARAHGELAALAASPRGAEVALTAGMLLATAEFWLGDGALALERLDRLRVAAAGAHPTLRSEIALRRARVFYEREDLERAIAALAEVSPAADIVSAQALNYGGWIAMKRGDHAGAVPAFVASVERLDRCRHRDRYLEANCLQALAYIAGECFDAAAWAFVVERSARLDWSADGLGLPRYWMAMGGSLAHEALGAPLLAIRATGEAVQLAPTPAYRVRALCRRARIGRDLGDTFLALDIMDRARIELEAIDAAGLEGDERLALLDVAQGLARAAMDTGTVAPAAARAVFARYREPRRSSVVAMVENPFTIAVERSVEAAVLDAEGDAAGALRLYSDAFRRFRDLGYRRRAVACALRLGELGGDDEHFAYVVAQTAGLTEHYWARLAIRRRARLYSDPVAAKLSPIQREVLVLILTGATLPEIALARSRAVSTVKHITCELMRAFEARSRAALMAECARRRIGTD